jgi:hypothetical protein
MRLPEDIQYSTQSVSGAGGNVSPLLKEKGGEEAPPMVIESKEEKIIPIFQHWERCCGDDYQR